MKTAFLGIQTILIATSEYQDVLDWLEVQGMTDFTNPGPIHIIEEGNTLLTIGFEHLNDAMRFKLAWGGR